MEMKFYPMGPALCSWSLPWLLWPRRKKTNVGGIEDESEPGSPASQVKATILCSGWWVSHHFGWGASCHNVVREKICGRKKRRLKTEANPLGRYGG